MLSPTQARLQDDLRGLIEGDVRCDETTLHLFSTDASLFEIRPQGIVWPKSVKDVVACVNYAAAKKIPIHPRGAGTGRSGGALGHGLILDFTRYMRRLIRTDDDSIAVQPGAVRGRINTMLQRSHQRMIGPDPGFPPTTTLGSWLACDGAGMHWLKYGSPRNAILSLQAVLATGESVELQADFRSEEQADNETEKRLIRGVREIMTPSLREIHLEQTDDSPDRSGYRLEGVLPTSPLGEPLSGGVNLVRLLAGSEGTLALITELRIKTVPDPVHLGGVLFLFDSLEKAVRAVSLIQLHGPNCCELLDRRRTSMVREWNKKYQSLIPKETEAVLYVEIDEPQANRVTDRLNAMIDDLRTDEHLCFGFRQAYHPREIEFFRGFLHRGELALSRMPPPFKAVPLFEDVFVPIDKLPAFLVLVQNIFKRYEILASFCGHVGQGHLRMNPIVSTEREDVAELLLRLVEEVNAEVLRQGGGISCDGACGLVGTHFLTQQHQFLSPLFQSIKTLFDPQNLLNPGKVVALDSDDHWIDSLRLLVRK